VVQLEYPQTACLERGAYNLSMSGDQSCARCQHPESDHRNNMCVGLVKPRYVRCDCKAFVSRREDASQAATRIARKATEDH
jgi:hypothetical protein